MTEHSTSETLTWRRPQPATLYVDPELHRELKQEAARRGISLSSAVANAIRLYLAAPSASA